MVSKNSSKKPGAKASVGVRSTTSTPIEKPIFEKREEEIGYLLASLAIASESHSESMGNLVKAAMEGATDIRVKAFKKKKGEQEAITSKEYLKALQDIASLLPLRFHMNSESPIAKLYDRTLEEGASKLGIKGIKG
jgi:hypothetical protein